MNEVAADITNEDMIAISVFAVKRITMVGRDSARAGEVPRRAASTFNRPTNDLLHSQPSPNDSPRLDFACTKHFSRRTIDRNAAASTEPVQKRIASKVVMLELNPLKVVAI